MTEGKKPVATNIFVNLPVTDLTKSKAFFSQLGYALDGSNVRPKNITV